MLLTVLRYPATHFNFELRTLCLSAFKEFAPEWVSTATSPEYVPSRRKYMWGRTMGLPSTALLCTNVEFYRAKSYSKIPFLLSCFQHGQSFFTKVILGLVGRFSRQGHLPWTPANLTPIPETHKRCKERTDSTKLTPDLHMHIMVCTRTNIHHCTYMRNNSKI